MHPFQIQLPRLNANDETVKLSRWLVGEGEHVATGKIIGELETSKATSELEAPADGYLELVVQAGTEGLVGAVAAVIHAEPFVRKAAAPAVAGTASGSAKVSRKAEVLAAELRIDARSLKTSGIVTEKDVMEAAAARAPVSPKAEPVQKMAGRPLTPVERGMARMVMRSLHESAPAYMTRDLPAEKMLAWVSATAQATKRVVSPMDAIIYMMHRLLAQKPFRIFNSRIDGDNLVERENRAIGVTVDLGGKLVIGNIRDEDCARVEDVALRRFDIAMKLARGTLSADELVDTGFTVSAIEAAGLLNHFPLLPLGQAGIIGITGVRRVAVVIEDEAGPRVGTQQVIGCCLAYDHRFITGISASRLLERLGIDMATGSFPE